MVFPYEVTIESRQALTAFEDSPEKLGRIFARAVNKIARDGRSDAAKEIRRRIAFPAGYLDPSNRRLIVTRMATPAEPEGRISARTRPTSLARFARGNLTPGKKGGVTVTVKPGSTRFMKRAFPIGLRLGLSDGSADDLGNLGLAIRLRPGEAIQNKRQMVRMKPGKKSSLYLLYGPSVDQVFRTVREDLRPDLERELENEILRLMDL